MCVSLVLWLLVFLVDLCGQSLILVGLPLNIHSLMTRSSMFAVLCFSADDRLFWFFWLFGIMRLYISSLFSLLLVGCLPCAVMIDKSSRVRNSCGVEPWILFGCVFFLCWVFLNYFCHLSGVDSEHATASCRLCVYSITFLISATMYMAIFFL